MTKMNEDLINEDKLSLIIIKTIFKNTYDKNDWSSPEYIENNMHDRFTLMFEKSVKKVINNSYYKEYIKNIVEKNIENIIKGMFSLNEKVVDDHIRKYINGLELDDLLLRSFSEEELMSLIDKKKKLEVKID